MQNSNSQIYLFIIVAFVLALMLVGFIVTILYMYQRRQHRQEQMMTQMRDEYEQELLKSQLEIQETTFKNIAQEIHDNIGQTLSLVKLTLSTLPVEKDSAIYSTISDSKEMLNKAIFDLADLSKSLHTDRIAHVGLSEAIQFELNMLKKTGLFDTHLHVSGDIRSHDAQNEIFIFRITQEILNNIVKHSKANNIDVQLLFGHNLFTLTIKDDGVGFDMARVQQNGSPSGGVGLKSMRNRAKLIVSPAPAPQLLSNYHINCNLQKILTTMAVVNTKIRVAMADDHKLLRKALANLINSFDNFSIVLEADDGEELIKSISSQNLPDIVLLDVGMPKMNGYETAEWMRKHYPQVKVVALSMYNNENAVIRMLKLGVKGYIMKNIDPADLKTALDTIVSKGFFYSEYVTGKLVYALNSEESAVPITISEKERQFLKLACSEFTYKDIAERMFVSHRTIDDYRISLFEKLKVKTRVGLVLYAIKNGLVEMS
jgi:DNA-binding NarL/FixJ family response regulator